jgi:mevalonate pyrophosphate decarboxylase
MLVFSRLLFTLRTPLPYIALNGKLKASLISVFNTNILFHSSSAVAAAAAHTLSTVQQRRH